MPAVLAVDLGKTGCRLSVSDDAGDVPEIWSGDGAPGLADPSGVVAAESAVLALSGAALGGVTPDHVCVGAAGAATAPDAARRLARRLAGHWPRAEVVVASDAVTSHAGALDGAPGVVLAAGTGAVVLGVARDGTVVRVDGAGPWLGDDGSGAWVGRHALRAVLRAVDGRGPATALSAVAAMFFGCEPESLPTAIGASGAVPSATAAFAPAVGRAAAAGDETALGILLAAADLLAESVRVAVRRVTGATGTSAVATALTGGLLQIGPVLLDPLTARLRSGDIDLRPAHGTSLDGARLLALHADTVHEGGLVRRAPAGATR